MGDYDRSPLWPSWLKWYPDDYVPIGGQYNPRWEEWIKEHPEYDKDGEDAVF